MADNPFTGRWTDRSLLNDPDLSTAFDQLEFGRGTIAINDGPHITQRHDWRTRLVSDSARLAILRLARTSALPGQRAGRRRRVDLRLHRLAGSRLAGKHRCPRLPGYRGLGHAHHSSLLWKWRSRPGGCGRFVLCRPGLPREFMTKTNAWMLRKETYE